MKAGGIEVAVVVGWFPVQYGDDVAIAKFNGGIRKNEFAEWSIQKLV